MQTNFKNKTNFFDRIMQIIDYEGIKNVSDFAVNYLNYDAPQKINRLKQEGNNPSYEIILDIVNKFEKINPEWLLTGEGPMLKKDKNSINSQKEDVFDVNKKNLVYDNANESHEEIVNKLKDDKISLMQEKMDLIIENADLKTANISLTHQLKEYEDQIKDLQLHNKELIDKALQSKKEKTTSKKEQLLPNTNIPIDKISKHTSITKNR